MRWKPKADCKKRARHYEKIVNKGGRLVFHSICESCGDIVPEVTTAVDHIDPVVPLAGFDSWDNVIERMFCEVDGLQLLCDDCHKTKTTEERLLRAEFKRTRND